MSTSLVCQINFFMTKFSKWFEKRTFSLLMNSSNFEEQLGRERRLTKKFREMDTLTPISTAMDGKTG